MNVLLSLLIIAINPDVPIKARYPDGTEVFRCPFDPSWDENFDGWPDGWTRRRGPGFPHYVTIQISRQTSPVGDRCLRIELDGGGAVAYSPPIRVGPLYSYVLEGFVRTEGLRNDQAYFSITMLDKDRHRLETFDSEKIRDSRGWKKLRLGPISPRFDEVRFAVIGLHLEPGSRQDLKGVALFDDVWLGRMPRISLAANSVHHVYTTPDQITVTCNASGFTEQDTRLTFCLEDAWGNLAAKTERPLEVRTAPRDGELLPDGPSDDPPPLIGAAQWHPPIPGPGFYRVRVAMSGRQTPVRRRELTLAVVDPHHAPSNSEFGWSLPGGREPLPLPELSRLLAQAGIHWVKYPLWSDALSGGEQTEELIHFSERLAIQEIELVGLLDDPPAELRDRFDNPDTLEAAQIFTAASKVWYTSLESVLMRMATRVRWWQLGADRDTSFVGYPNLAEKITEVKAELDRVGQDVNLGFGWGWMDQVPQDAEGNPAWRFLALSADPPLTHRELPDYLAATQEAQLQRWVVLEPLSQRRYSLEGRITDLIRRMISAKMHRAEGIFIPDPFHTDHGLMNDDGTPGELFLPWRTAAVLLGGTRYLGAIALPSGSHNHIFSRAGQAVMVVWNETPVREVVYLGDDVRQVDLWGRSTTPAGEDHRQVIEVGPLPAFVTGVDEEITRWRQGFAIAKTRIPSDFGRRQQNSLRLKSDFDWGIVGTLELVAPDAWEVNPRQTGFLLAGGEDLEQPFEIMLPYTVTSGRHPIRADFEIQTDRAHRFSVYRHIDVGMGDLQIDVATRLNEQGELEIEQRFVNQTEQQVSFRCHLFVPERRRMKTEVLVMARSHDVKTYRLADGEPLVGKVLWLRAEEIDGPRVLNYRFPAKR